MPLVRVDDSTVRQWVPKRDDLLFTLKVFRLIDSHLSLQGNALQHLSELFIVNLSLLFVADDKFPPFLLLHHPHILLSSLKELLFHLQLTLDPPDKEHLILVDPDIVQMGYLMVQIIDEDSIQTPQIADSSELHPHIKDTMDAGNSAFVNPDGVFAKCPPNCVGPFENEVLLGFTILVVDHQHSNCLRSHLCLLKLLLHLNQVYNARII